MRCILHVQHHGFYRVVHSQWIVVTIEQAVVLFVNKQFGLL
jgi:hypothetical protein